MIGFGQQNLAELFAQIPISADISSAIPEMNIYGITNDSRAVKPGYLFVAQVGGTSDGHQFIPQAIKNGACAVVGTRELDTEVPYLRVRDSREALAYLSAAFYSFPARQLVVSCQFDIPDPA